VTNLDELKQSLTELGEAIDVVLLERDQARADAKVLAAEVWKWRNGMESETFNRFGYAEYDATDASGALERNK
jgi:hypothetical protein